MQRCVSGGAARDASNCLAGAVLTSLLGLSQCQGDVAQRDLDANNALALAVLHESKAAIETILLNKGCDDRRRSGRRFALEKPHAPCVSPVI